MDAASKSRIGIIVLAAGESARLGRPKQLLRFEGETLINRAAQTALAVCENVVVVLGANSDRIRKEIEHLPLAVAVNEDWQSGMSSSIKTGLEKLLAIEPQVSAVIVQLCDQPQISAVVLNRLLETYKQSQAKIVASEYAATGGVPALFDKDLFAEILNLSAQNGAKNLIEKHSSATEKIPVPEAAADIDTQTDYEKLLAGSQS